MSLQVQHRIGCPRRFECALLFLGALFVVVGIASAEDPATQTPKPPVDLDLGFDTRVREVTLHNLLDFDSHADGGTASDAHFFRVRHRLTATFKLRGGISIATRFTTEWRKYLDPYTNPQKTEIILDRAYIDIPKVPGIPVALRVGRQDIIRGEGFVLLEGGPRDGSRSIYHNAILATMSGDVFGLRDSKIDLFAIRNPALDPFVVANDRADDPEVGRMGARINDVDETAFGVYVQNQSLFSGQNDLYYIYKEEEPENKPEPYLKLHTVGSRSSGDLPWELKYAAEAAYQFGQWQDSNTGEKGGDVRAYGGHGWVSRSFLAMYKPTVKLGAVYLSGDDISGDLVSDANYEGWNPVFSRWPKWSELYIYTLIAESGQVAKWSNLISLNAQLSLQIHPKAAVSYTYHKLRAPELAASALSIPPEPGMDKDRGHLHAWKVTANFSPKVSAHFLAERFVPGKFYHAAQDDAYFLRWELMIKK